MGGLLAEPRAAHRRTAGGFGEDLAYPAKSVVSHEMLQPPMPYSGSRSERYMLGPWLPTGGHG